MCRAEDVRTAEKSHISVCVLTYKRPQLLERLLNLCGGRLLGGEAWRQRRERDEQYGLHLLTFSKGSENSGSLRWGLTTAATSLLPQARFA